MEVEFHQDKAPLGHQYEWQYEWECW